MICMSFSVSLSFLFSFLFFDPFLPLLHFSHQYLDPSFIRLILYYTLSLFYSTLSLSSLFFFSLFPLFPRIGTSTLPHIGTSTLPFLGLYQPQRRPVWYRRALKAPLWDAPLFSPRENFHPETGTCSPTSYISESTSKSSDNPVNIRKVDQLIILY